MRTNAEGAVLVVDDSPVNRMMLTAALQALGHSVTSAVDGVDAPERLAARTLSTVASRGDALGRLARTFQVMAVEVRAREERLHQTVRELRIEVDAARRERRVAEITGSDYFRDLRRRAEDLRRAVEG